MATPSSKKAVLFSRMPLPIISNLIAQLRTRNYTVPLLVCAPGPNHSLAPTACSSLGDLVGAVLDTIDNPPAILCITRTSQVTGLYKLIDPDFALVYGFSYTIPPAILRLRAPVVNLHPAPLPGLPGASPYPWPILRPDRFPLQDYKITWHYMTEDIDRGPVIMELEPGLADEETFTTDDLFKACNARILESFGGVLRLVEEGFPGTPQGPCLPGQEEVGGLLHDDQRMILEWMTVEHVLRLGRALCGGRSPPLFRYREGLYHVLRMSQAEESVTHTMECGTITRAGTLVTYRVRDGAVVLAVRKI